MKKNTSNGQNPWEIQQLAAKSTGFTGLYWDQQPWENFSKSEAEVAQTAVKVAIEGNWGPSRLNPSPMRGENL